MSKQEAARILLAYQNGRKTSEAKLMEALSVFKLEREEVENVLDAANSLTVRRSRYEVLVPVPVYLV